MDVSLPTESDTDDEIENQLKARKENRFEFVVARPKCKAAQKVNHSGGPSCTVQPRRSINFDENKKATKSDNITSNTPAKNVEQLRGRKRLSSQSIDEISPKLSRHRTWQAVKLLKRKKTPAKIES